VTEHEAASSDELQRRPWRALGARGATGAVRHDGMMLEEVAGPMLRGSGFTIANLDAKDMAKPVCLKNAVNVSFSANDAAGNRCDIELAGAPGAARGSNGPVLDAPSPRGPATADTLAHYAATGHASAPIGELYARPQPAR